MHLMVDGRVLDDRYHGVGRITAALLTELVGLPDLQLTLVLRPGQHAQRFDIQALRDTAGISIVDFDHDLSSKAQYLKWPGLLRTVGADCALFPYNLGAAVSGPGARFVIVHDCIIESRARFAPDRRTRLLYRLLTTLVVNRNQVLTPSHASAAAIRRYYRVKVPESRVITWGIDEAFGRPAAPLGQIAGQVLPARYYLQVGARRPHKNVAVLVRALSLLPETDHLVLVGSVDSRMVDPVPALAEQLGVTNRIIHLPGVTDAELLSLYSGAQAFLYPSLVEGVGLPLLEAMAAGLPVIASDIAVFREVSDGAARLVDPNDHHRWQQAISALAGDPALRAELVRRGRQVADRASWPASAGKLLAALRAV